LDRTDFTFCSTAIENLFESLRLRVKLFFW